MNWWLAAGSLAAVLALAGIARMLKLGGAQHLTNGKDAIGLAEVLVSGFEGQVGIVAADGGRAAVAGGPGDLVVIEPLGARYRATRFKAARVVMVHPEADGTKLALELQPGIVLRITVADGEAARAFAETLT
ncbi:MAG: hypothetical protein B7Y97_00325 [Sphingomonas sp. 32-66-10]|nr:MAG: hypothetical protein B7Y97_00325 [Sphingomonas sp. 32-66-10]